MKLQELDMVDWFKMQATIGRLMDKFDSGLRPAQFVLGVSVLFLMTMRRFGLRPVDVLDRTANIIRDMQEGAKVGPGKRCIGALELWLRKEVKYEEQREHQEYVTERIDQLVRGLDPLGEEMQRLFDEVHGEVLRKHAAARSTHRYASKRSVAKSRKTLVKKLQQAMIKRIDEILEAQKPDER